MKRYFILLTMLLLPILTFAQKKDETKIRKMLANQVMEWNKGNIEGYMVGYWRNDSLLFIGSKRPKFGYTTTLNRYKEAYPDIAHMGKLTSVIISIKKISHHYYFVEGSWALERTAGNISGYYTLLLRKLAGKWVIIADHSS